jgi:hypothetical protein
MFFGMMPRIIRNLKNSTSPMILDSLQKNKNATCHPVLDLKGVMLWSNECSIS